MVQRAVAEARRPDAGVGLISPTFLSVLGRGLPGFLREGFLPLAAFYAGMRLSGLIVAMGAAAAASALIYAFERAAGRDGLLVRLSLLFVGVQTGIGLVAHSATAYLAAPVLLTAAWGLLFLGSVVIGRPLAGALACAWYPFPPAFRATPEFRRVFGVESIVWGVYLLARSAVRLAALGHGGGLAFYLLVVAGTGTPLMLVLVAWSVWYAIRRFSDGGDEPVPAAGVSATWARLRACSRRRSAFG